MMKETIFKKNTNVFNYLKKFFNDVISKKQFFIPVLFSTFISFFYSFANRTVSIDDLAQELYYANDGYKIRGLRWGQFLCNRLFSTVRYTPFLNRFFGVCFLLITVVFLSSIIYFLSEQKTKIWEYTVFSSIFVSFPLINEIWEYYESLTVPFCFAIISFALLYQIINNEQNIKDIVYIGFLLSFVMSGYESLIFVYISVVFSVLLLKSYKNKELDWIREGLRFALPLFVSLVLKYVIGYMLLFVSGLEYRQDGMSSLNWLDKGFTYSLKQLIFNAWYYGVRGLSYFPITEFDLAAIVFVILLIIKSRDNLKILLIGFLFLLSLFLLPIIQGGHFGYRMAQTVQYFVAFVAYLLTIVSEKKGHVIYNSIIVMFLFLSLRQSIYLHSLLALNNQRSENEAYIVREIGTDLYKNYDLNKTVIFVGNYNLGDFINEQITVKKDSLAGVIESQMRNYFGYSDQKYDLDIVSTNVNSLLNWSKDAFGSQMMFKYYFSYYGFKINVLEKITEKELKYYENLSKNNNMKPLQILEFDNYILVNLG